MLLDGPMTWPSQDLMWRRFVVESSLCLWVRMIEGSLLPREIELCKNKIKKLTYVRHMNWYFTMLFSTVITGTLKWLDVKKNKNWMKWRFRLTEYFFIRFIGSIVSLLKCWEFGANLASFTCRRQISCLLFAYACHAWRNMNVLWIPAFIELEYLLVPIDCTQAAANRFQIPGSCSM